MGSEDSVSRAERQVCHAGRPVTKVRPRPVPAGRTGSLRCGAMAARSDRRDFTQAPLRGRVEAFLLSVGAPADEKLMGDRKRATIGTLTGTVVEFGPGPGGNMGYYGPDVHLIAVEPNPAMHDRLREAADRHGVDMEIRTQHGEDLDLPDGSADAVVGTLLLCGVDDPAMVVEQIKRVLRPGGTYVFFEHVVAEPGSGTRRLQRVVAGPHRWLFNGCELDRDTGALLRDAGFSDIDIERIDAGPGAVWTRPRIFGRAIR